MGNFQKSRVQEKLIYHICQNILGKGKGKERLNGKGGGKNNLTRQGKVLIARKSWVFHFEVHYGNNGQIHLAAKNECFPSNVIDR